MSISLCRRFSFLTFFGALCLAAGQSAAQHPRAPGGESEKADVVDKDKSATVAVEIDKPTRERVEAAIKESSPRTVRLSVRDVKPPADLDHVYGFRVFVNAPDATAATPDTDPHYAGARAFQPKGTGGEPESFLVDIGDTLKRLKERGELRLDKPLRITLVPVTSPEAPSDAAKTKLAFQGAALTVPVKK